MKKIITYGTYLCLLFLPVTILSAQTPGQDSVLIEQDTNKVDIDFADVFEYIQVDDTTVLQKLIGNVELKQDSVYMYCDSAIIENETNVFAMGSVIFQQGDSLSVFADTLYYNGSIKEADLYGNVILVNKRQQLFTDSLHYDLNTEIATYLGGATLVEEETQLTSKRGYYYVKSQEVFFKDSVMVINPDFNLRSDTLKLNAETKVVTFLAPTLIATDSSKIYCEEGYYDVDNEYASFQKNAQFQQGKQIATADSINYDGVEEVYSLMGNAFFEEEDRFASGDIIRYYDITDVTFLSGNAEYKDGDQYISGETIHYDGKKEVYSTSGRSYISKPPQILEADQVDYGGDDDFGMAIGNVVWQDTASHITILCDTAAYKGENGYLKASGPNRSMEGIFPGLELEAAELFNRPLMINVLEEDSMYMVADTLYSFNPDTLGNDSSRLLLAYRDVRIYKSNLQAVCDSLSYDSRDSLFRFFYGPVIWSDTSQFTADSISILNTENNIDRIFLKDNSFIINSPDEIFFNQIKGKEITAFFKEGELNKMDVSGNAESVYYALDSVKAYVGVNETVSSNMLLHFGDNQITNIKFFEQPTATMHPMSVNHDDLRIKGWEWISKGRPRSIIDLFTLEKVTRAVAPSFAADKAPSDGAPDRSVPPGVKRPDSKGNRDRGTKATGKRGEREKE